MSLVRADTFLAATNEQFNAAKKPHNTCRSNWDTKPGQNWTGGSKGWNHLAISTVRLTLDCFGACCLTETMFQQIGSLHPKPGSQEAAPQLCVANPGGQAPRMGEAAFLVHSPALKRRQLCPLQYVCCEGEWNLTCALAAEAHGKIWMAWWQIRTKPISQMKKIWSANRGLYFKASLRAG